MKLQLDRISGDNLFVTYDEAWLFCACHFLDNKSDWRLPTADEYNSHNNIYGWIDRPDQYVGYPHNTTSYFTPVRTIDD